MNEKFTGSNYLNLRIFDKSYDRSYKDSLRDKIPVLRSPMGGLIYHPVRSPGSGATPRVHIGPLRTGPLGRDCNDGNGTVRSSVKGNYNDHSIMHIPCCECAISVSK